VGITAGVVCVTSAGLLYQALNCQGRISSDQGSAILDRLFPVDFPTPIVTVHDGHPHTLSFLGSVRGDRTRNLGVTQFGQSSSVSEAHQIHGIDAASIADAALDLVGR